MKDNLFEMLLNLFETSLAQLQENQKSAEQEVSAEVSEEETAAETQMVYVKRQQDTSTRVFTYDEQMKLTKASYQFLMRLRLWGIINAQLFEMVMNQLQFSDSRIVTLQEAKWTVRNVLAASLSNEQQAFLDLVLYQSEDEVTLQ